MNSLKIVLLSLACAFCVSPLRAQEHGRQREIAVISRGMVSIIPEGVEFRLGVESDGPTVEAVRRENDAKMIAVLKALKDAGVPERDITTTTMSLAKNFTPAEARQTKKEGVSFKLAREVFVRLHKVAGAEDVFAAAMKADANKVTDFAYTNAKMDEYRDAAVALAIKDAIRLADQQASQFGAKRGKVTWISQETQRTRDSGDRVIVTGSMIAAPFSTGVIPLEMSIYANFELE